MKNSQKIPEEANMSTDYRHAWNPHEPEEGNLSESAVWVAN